MTAEELEEWLKTNRYKTPEPMSENLLVAATRAFHSVFPGGNHFEGMESVIYRIGTVRIKPSSTVNMITCVYGNARNTAYDESTRCIIKAAPQACSYVTEHFLRQTGYGSFLMESMNLWSRTHRAYAHVDAYRDRPASAAGWHKDTWGYTLFVGLLYFNNDTIAGPDLIINPGRLSYLTATKKPVENGYDEHTENTIQRSDPYLPTDFVSVINQIKQQDAKEAFENVINAGGFQRKE